MPEEATEKKEKKAPRKRTVRKKVASSKRAPATKTARKAPLRTAAQKEKMPISNSTKVGVAFLVAFCVVFGISAFIGTSDKGEIDVTTTIAERVAALEARGDLAASAAVRGVSAAPTTEKSAPVLVGHGNRETRQQKLEKAARKAQAPEASQNEETASTTEATDSASTTTEDGASEDVAEENDGPETGGEEVADEEGNASPETDEANETEETVAE